MSGGSRVQVSQGANRRKPIQKHFCKLSRAVKGVGLKSRCVTLRGFESHSLQIGENLFKKQLCNVAQLVARLAHNQEDLGSRPSIATCSRGPMDKALGF